MTSIIHHQAMKLGWVTLKAPFVSDYLLGNCANKPAGCQFFPVANKQMCLLKTYRLEFSLSPYLHLSTEHVFVENKSSDWMTLRGVTAHTSSGAGIWDAAWLTSLMWILRSHKTSKSAECVIILVTNQPSICEWDHATISWRNLTSFRVSSHFNSIFVCDDKHIFFSEQFKCALVWCIKYCWIWDHSTAEIPEKMVVASFPGVIVSTTSPTVMALFYFFGWVGFSRIWPDVGLDPPKKWKLS